MAFLDPSGHYTDVPFRPSRWGRRSGTSDFQQLVKRQTSKLDETRTDSFVERVQSSDGPAACNDIASNDGGASASDSWKDEEDDSCVSETNSPKDTARWRRRTETYRRRGRRLRSAYLSDTDEDSSSESTSAESSDDAKAEGFAKDLLQVCRARRWAVSGTNRELTSMNVRHVATRAAAAGTFLGSSSGDPNRQIHQLVATLRQSINDDVTYAREGMVYSSQWEAQSEEDVDQEVPVLDDASNDDPVALSPWSVAASNTGNTSEEEIGEDNKKDVPLPNIVNYRTTAAADGVPNRLIYAGRISGGPLTQIHRFRHTQVQTSLVRLMETSLPMESTLASGDLDDEFESEDDIEDPIRSGNPRSGFPAASAALEIRNPDAELSGSAVATRSQPLASPVTSDNDSADPVDAKYLISAGGISTFLLALNIDGDLLRSNDAENAAAIRCDVLHLLVSYLRGSKRFTEACSRSDILFRRAVELLTVPEDFGFAETFATEYLSITDRCADVGQLPEIEFLIRTLSPWDLARLARFIGMLLCENSAPVATLRSHPSLTLQTFRFNRPRGMPRRPSRTVTPVAGVLNNDRYLRYLGRRRMGLGRRNVRKRSTRSAQWGDAPGRLCTCDRNVSGGDKLFHSTQCKWFARQNQMRLLNMPFLLDRIMLLLKFQTVPIPVPMLGLCCNHIPFAANLEPVIPNAVNIHLIQLSPISPEDFLHRTFPGTSDNIIHGLDTQTPRNGPTAVTPRQTLFQRASHALWRTILLAPWRAMFLMGPAARFLSNTLLSFTSILIPWLSSFLRFFGRAFWENVPFLYGCSQHESFAALPDGSKSNLEPEFRRLERRLRSSPGSRINGPSNRSSESNFRDATEIRQIVQTLREVSVLTRESPQNASSEIEGIPSETLERLRDMLTAAAPGGIVLLGSPDGNFFQLSGSRIIPFAVGSLLDSELSGVDSAFQDPILNFYVVLRVLLQDPAEQARWAGRRQRQTIAAFVDTENKLFELDQSIAQFRYEKRKSQQQKLSKQRAELLRAILCATQDETTDQSGLSVLLRDVRDQSARIAASFGPSLLKSHLFRHFERQMRPRAQSGTVAESDSVVRSLVTAFNADVGEDSLAQTAENAVDNGMPRDNLFLPEPSNPESPQSSSNAVSRAVRSEQSSPNALTRFFQTLLGITRDRSLEQPRSERFGNPDEGSSSYFVRAMSVLLTDTAVDMSPSVAGTASSPDNQIIAAPGNQRLPLTELIQSTPDGLSRESIVDRIREARSFIDARLLAITDGRASTVPVSQTPILEANNATGGPAERNLSGSIGQWVMGLFDGDMDEFASNEDLLRRTIAERLPEFRGTPAPSRPPSRTEPQRQRPSTSMEASNPIALSSQEYVPPDQTRPLLQPLLRALTGVPDLSFGEAAYYLKLAQMAQHQHIVFFVPIALLDRPFGGFVKRLLHKRNIMQVLNSTFETLAWLEPSSNRTMSTRSLVRDHSGSIARVPWVYLRELCEKLGNDGRARWSEIQNGSLDLWRDLSIAANFPLVDRLVWDLVADNRPATIPGDDARAALNQVSRRQFCGTTSLNKIKEGSTITEDLSNTGELESAQNSRSRLSNTGAMKPASIGYNEASLPSLSARNDSIDNSRGDHPTLTGSSETVSLDVIMDLLSMSCPDWLSTADVVEKLFVLNAQSGTRKQEGQPVTRSAAFFQSSRPQTGRAFFGNTVSRNSVEQGLLSHNSTSPDAALPPVCERSLCDVVLEYLRLLQAICSFDAPSIASEIKRCTLSRNEREELLAIGRVSRGLRRPPIVQRVRDDVLAHHPCNISELYAAEISIGWRRTEAEPVSLQLESLKVPQVDESPLPSSGNPEKNTIAEQLNSSAKNVSNDGLIGKLLTIVGTDDSKLPLSGAKSICPDSANKSIATSSQTSNNPNGVDATASSSGDVAAAPNSDTTTARHADATADANDSAERGERRTIRRFLFESETGIFTKLMVLYAEEPPGSIYKFTLACTLNSILRGADPIIQIYAVKAGLLQVVIRDILRLTPGGFDLLAELIRFNPYCLHALNELLDQYPVISKDLWTVARSDLVASSIFYGVAVLTLEFCRQIAAINSALPLSSDRVPWASFHFLPYLEKHDEELQERFVAQCPGLKECLENPVGDSQGMPVTAAFEEMLLKEGRWHVSPIGLSAPFGKGVSLVAEALRAEIQLSQPESAAEESHKPVVSAKQLNQIRVRAKELHPSFQIGGFFDVDCAELIKTPNSKFGVDLPHLAETSRVIETGSSSNNAAAFKRNLKVGRKHRKSQRMTMQPESGRLPRPMRACSPMLQLPPGELEVSNPLSLTRFSTPTPTLRKTSTRANGEYFESPMKQSIGTRQKLSFCLAFPALKASIYDNRKNLLDNGSFHGTAPSTMAVGLNSVANEIGSSNKVFLLKRLAVSVAFPAASLNSICAVSTFLLFALMALLGGDLPDLLSSVKRELYVEERQFSAFIKRKRRLRAACAQETTASKPNEFFSTAATQNVIETPTAAEIPSEHILMGTIKTGGMKSDSEVYVPGSPELLASDEDNPQPDGLTGQSKARCEFEEDGVRYQILATESREDPDLCAFDLSRHRHYKQASSGNPLLESKNDIGQTQKEDASNTSTKGSTSLANDIDEIAAEHPKLAYLSLVMKCSEIPASFRRRGHMSRGIFNLRYVTRQIVLLHELPSQLSCRLLLRMFWSDGCYWFGMRMRKRIVFSGGCLRSTPVYPLHTGSNQQFAIYCCPISCLCCSCSKYLPDQGLHRILYCTLAPINLFLSDASSFLTKESYK